MTRGVGTAIQNNFVNGLLTENTGMNFPENAVKDCDNVVFEKTGIVRRRYGFDYEANFTTETLANDGVSQLWEWETVSSDGNTKFIVAQRGQTIRFYLLDEGVLTIKSFTIDLTSHKSATTITAEQIQDNKASFSSGNGYLFVAHKYCEPFYVSYDADTDSITETEISITIRDFEGVDDGLETGDRPTTLSLEHEYNLQNQGWYTSEQEGASDPNGNPLKKWESSTRTDYPSNADVWFQYKDENELFNAGWIVRFSIGNAPAAKGHYIYDAFNIERKVIYPSTYYVPTGSETTGLETTVSTENSGNNRPEFTEFFAGRVWWAGVNYNKFSSRIYFSKVIERDEDFGKCYQVNDPTAEGQSDLLPTDGGVVVIPDIAKVLYMVNIENNLVVMASNGVWMISGADFSGFTADSYQVRKLSSIGCLSPYSVVEAEGIPVWWTSEGIYTLVKPQGAQTYEVVSISNNTIKTFYNQIPVANKFYTQGTYDKLNREVVWIFRSTAASTFEDNFVYDRILKLNIDTKAFYPYTAAEGCHFTALVEIAGQSTSTIEENVVDNASAQVVDSGAANVTASVTQTSVSGSVIKYWIVDTSVGTSATDGYTFGEENNTSYVDWFSKDSTGVDYTSSFTTGYIVRGESHKKFQNHYITITSESDVNSSFFINGRWDYTISSAANKYSIRQQGYLHKSNRDYNQRRLKLRGMGPVLQYHVTSEAGKPFAIVGWATLDSVAGGV